MSPTRRFAIRDSKPFQKFGVNFKDEVLEVKED
jgi:hypothetical protein